MRETKIEQLMKQIGGIHRKSDFLNGSYPALHKNELQLIEKMIRQFLLDNHDSKIGELEAKVYAYEQIIANSNFKPVLEKRIDVPEPPHGFRSSVNGR